MSSRRTVGEDNILAMLERDSARRSGTRASNLRLACYGAAAAFAGILVGGVAWLAYDNHKTAEQLQAEHDALNAVPPVVSSSGAPLQSPPPMLTAPPPGPVAGPAEAPHAAVIVDESVTGVPPLVMLPPHEVAPARAGAQAAARVGRSGVVPPLVRTAAKPAPNPARELAKNTARDSAKDNAAATPAKPRKAQAVARGSDRKADTKAHKKADTKVDKKAAKGAARAKRTAARDAKARPQRSAGKTAAEPARQRKTAAAAPQVDNDVALISAIISQSERHRGERDAAAACAGAGAKCPSKPTRH